MDRYVNEPMINEMFNVVGFNLTWHLNEKKRRKLMEHFNFDKLIGFCQEYYLPETTTQDINSCGDDKEIEEELSGHDLRIILRAEEELHSCNNFVRIFPSERSTYYENFMEPVSHNNQILLRWEKKYCSDRLKGLEILKQLCEKKIHLTNFGKQSKSKSGKVSKSRRNIPDEKLKSYQSEPASC